jgi:hypothetical protein
LYTVFDKMVHLSMNASHFTGAIGRCCCTSFELGCVRKNHEHMNPPFLKAASIIRTDGRRILLFFFLKGAVERYRGAISQANAEVLQSQRAVHRGQLCNAGPDLHCAAVSKTSLLALAGGQCSTCAQSACRQCSIARLLCSQKRDFA